MSTSDDVRPWPVPAQAVAEMLTSDDGDYVDAEDIEAFVSARVDGTSLFITLEDALEEDRAQRRRRTYRFDFIEWVDESPRP